MSRFQPTEKMVLYLIRTVASEKGLGTWDHSHALYERTTGQRGRTQDSLKNQWKKLDHNRAEIGLDPDEFFWMETKKELMAKLQDLCSASSMYRRPSAADTATQKSTSSAADTYHGQLGQPPAENCRETYHAVEGSRVADPPPSTALTQSAETALGSRIHTALESINPILLDTTDAANTAPPATLNSIIEHASPARPAAATDDQTAMCDYSATGMAAVYNAAPPVQHACTLGPAANATSSTLPSGMMSMDKCCIVQQPHHGLVPSACGRWAYDHPTAYHRPTCCASGAWTLPARSVCQDMLGQEQMYRSTSSGILGGTAAYGFGSAYNTAIEETVDYASDTSTLNDSALYAFADEVGSLPTPAVIDGLTGMEPGLNAESMHMLNALSYDVPMWMSPECLHAYAASEQAGACF